MLSIDSLTLDLVFLRGKMPQEESLAALVPADEEEPRWQAIDADYQPEFEQQISPTAPFRRPEERRILAIDIAGGSLAAEEGAGFCNKDLRKDKELLLTIAADPAIRFARMGTLGGFADAVLVARSLQDIRAYALLLWVYSPMIDADGRSRSSQLPPTEIKKKAATFEKRIVELSEQDILEGMSGNFTRHDDLVVVDFLNNEGGYDFRFATEGLLSIAAIDRFSHFAGAPAGPKREEPKKEVVKEKALAPKAEKKSPGVVVKTLEDDAWFLFSDGFTPAVAASMGNRDYDQFLKGVNLEGRIRDRIYEHGANFAAPIEFLSEVFFDGKPLSKGTFEENAEDSGAGKSLKVMYPRYGAVTLLIDASDQRWVLSSQVSASHVSKILE